MEGCTLYRARTQDKISCVDMNSGQKAASAVVAAPSKRCMLADSISSVWCGQLRRKQCLPRTRRGYCARLLLVTRASKGVALLFIGTCFQNDGALELVGLPFFS